MANNCSLADLVDCDDQDKTITNFVEQKGIITDFIYSGVRNTNPMIRLLEGTKKEFPSGMGDTITRGILEVTSPNELDGLDWNPVRSNYPGNSACCNEYRDFTYGSRTVHGCLSQIGYKSPSFCKTDIVFKTKFLEQLMQIVMAMRNITTGVWGFWLAASYPKSVYCTILSKQWDHPEELGKYPSAPRPTTFINLEHLDKLNERITAVGGLIGSPIKDFQTILIGKNSYNRMKARRMEQNATLVGARGPEMALPNYNEYTVADLGRVIVWSSYAFILIDKPRRFREKGINETWEDAIVPSTINIRTDRGFKTERNPDYYNPNIAIYEETLWLNKEAVDWLVPPAALIAPMAVGDKQFFPATNYSGDFEAYYCPTDVKKKTVRFAADFMGGMMSLFPQKGRAVMHLACHLETCDDDDQICVGGAPVESIGNPIRDVNITATSGQLQVLVEGALPEACAPGSSLFMETERGDKFIVGSIVSTWAFPGNADIPQAGNYYIISFPTALAAAATKRELCDPWKRIVCLPASTVSDDPNVTPCGVCNNSPEEPGACVLRALPQTDVVRGIKTAAGAQTVTVANYTSAATLQTALNTWLTANGGGSSVVTLSADLLWSITVTGNPALVGAKAVYSDGFSDLAEAPFGASGDCDP